MFKSLRRKFITTAVGSVAVVIAILAIALNFINYYKLEERIDTTLLDASKSQALIKIFVEDGDDLIIHLVQQIIMVFLLLRLMILEG